MLITFAQLINYKFMQIFLPFDDPIKTAECLDFRRLNKQIIECNTILKAIDEKPGTPWRNHPVVRMYGDHTEFIRHYVRVLELYRNKVFTNELMAENAMAINSIPKFITGEFCNQHKRRLYTKDPIHYKYFECYGTSDENWYIVDNKLLIYKNGKLISTKPHNIKSDLRV